MMSRHDEPLLEALSPVDVASWLRMRGFEHSRNHGEFGAVFEREFNDQAIELILPTSPTVRDYIRRMSELVEDLAVAEDRPPSDVLTDLTLAPFDVIRVRSPDADDYGSMPLTAGIDLHREAENLIASAASAAASHQPRRNYRGRRLEEVSDYLNAVRLGQSQRGSFVLTILSRHDFMPERHSGFDLFSDHLESVAFGRKVTRKLATALAATERGLRDAVSAGAAPLTKMFSQGVSANFCTALAKLAQEGEGVDVSVNWSPVRPEDSACILRLRREDAPTLLDAARQLSRQEDEPDSVLEGIISVIREESARFDGTVTIEAHLYGGLRRVSVKFGEDDRDTVFEAAKEKNGCELWATSIERATNLCSRGLAIFPLYSRKTLTLSWRPSATPEVCCDHSRRSQ